jgi:hypothetical protein
MQNFSSPFFTQTDLEFFLPFFQENFRIFQKNTEENFKIMHVHAKFQLYRFHPDGLGQIFDHFLSKFQNFLK